MDHLTRYVCARHNVQEMVGINRKELGGDDSEMERFLGRHSDKADSAMLLFRSALTCT